MATALTGRTIAGSYKDLLQVYNGNQGIDSTLRRLSDGEGTDSSALISTNKFQVRPASNGTDTFEVVNSSGSVLFYIDTTNNKVVLPSGVTIEGDGSALTGIVSTGTGGSSAIGNLEVQADSDASGSGDIIFKIGTKEVARIPYSYASSLPTGVAGNYFIKTISDGWGNQKSGVKFDGVDDYYRSTSPFGDVDLGAKTLSFHLTIKTPTKFAFTISPTSSSNNRVYLLYDGTYLYFGTRTMGGVSSNIRATINLSTVKKVTAVLPSTGIANGLIYVDNVPIATTASALNVNAMVVANTIDLGTISSAGTVEYTKFDCIEAIIFATALSASDVNGLWNNGLWESPIPYKYLSGSLTNKLSASTFIDADWTKGTGWTIAGGTASCDGTQTDVSLLFTGTGTPFSGTLNKNVKLSVTVSNWVAGNVRLKNGSSTIVSSYKGSNGLLEIEGISTSESTNFVVEADADFVGDVTLPILNYAGRVFHAKDFGRVGLLDSSDNGNHGSSSGSPIALSAEQGLDVVRDVKTLVTGNTTLTSVVPKGYMLKQIIVQNNTANVYTLNVGSATSGGTDVVNASSIGASGFTTITVNKTFSATSAQTLYLQSGAWNSSSSTYYLIMERVAR